MYEYDECKGTSKNSCAGCLILFSVVLILISLCLSMCDDSKSCITNKREAEIASFVKGKKLELNKLAAASLNKDEFVCYAKNISGALKPATSERRAALDAGAITVEQFKANIAMIYDSIADKVFLECVNEAK